MCMGLSVVDLLSYPSMELASPGYFTSYPAHLQSGSSVMCPYWCANQSKSENIKPNKKGNGREKTVLSNPIHEVERSTGIL